MNDDIRDGFIGAMFGEGFAYTMYTIYAAKLREAGMIEAAMTVEKMAENEKEHFEVLLEKFRGMPETLNMMRDIKAHEVRDANEVYDVLQKQSSSINPEYAELASHLKAIEQHHADTMEMLHQLYHTPNARLVENGYLMICSHCGNFYKSEDEIPEKCPVCDHDKSDYIYAPQYKIVIETPEV